METTATNGAVNSAAMSEAKTATGQTAEAAAKATAAVPAVEYRYYQMDVAGKKLQDALNSVSAVNGNYFAVEYGGMKKATFKGAEKFVSLINFCRSTEDKKYLSAQVFATLRVFDHTAAGDIEVRSGVKTSDFQAFLSAKELKNLASTLTNGNENVCFTVVAKETPFKKASCMAEIKTKGEANFLKGSVPIPVLKKKDVTYFKPGKDESILGAVDLTAEQTREMVTAIGICSDKETSGTALDSVAMSFAGPTFDWAVTTGKRICVGQFSAENLVPAADSRFFLVKASDFRMMASMMRSNAKLKVVLMGYKKEVTADDGTVTTKPEPTRVLCRYLAPEKTDDMDSEVEVELRAVAPLYMEAKNPDYVSFILGRVKSTEEKTPVALKFAREDMVRACRILTVDGDPKAIIRLTSKSGNDICLTRESNAKMALSIKGIMEIGKGGNGTREDIGFLATDMITMLGALQLPLEKDENGATTKEEVKAVIHMNDIAILFRNVGKGITLGAMMAKIGAAPKMPEESEPEEVSVDAEPSETEEE